MWSAMSISVPGLKVRRMPPAALVNSDGADADRGGGPDAERAGGGVMSLVHVEAAALGQDVAAAEPAEHEFALVALDSGDGEAGNVAVREARRGLELVGEVAEPAAEHDQGGGLASAEKGADGVGRGHIDCPAWLRLERGRPMIPGLMRGATAREPAEPPQRRARRRHSSIPAIVAERKFASVPASMARKPSRARSPLRSGASAPMPPIWMPTELKLAKPASANDAMVKDRGSSVALSWPELGEGDELVEHGAGAEQAADGAAVVPLTPMTHAIGRPTQPSTVCRFSGNQGSQPCIEPEDAR